MFNSPLLPKGVTRLIKHRADGANGLLLRPFSMAFWLSVFVLAFVCAMPFLPVPGASNAPGFVRIVQDAVGDSSP
jgi:hypothetical protein